jgi:hypothetical protein
MVIYRPSNVSAACQNLTNGSSGEIYSHKQNDLQSAVNKELVNLREFVPHC